MSAEVRRRAAENAFRRAQAAGRPVEQDERFHAWIEEWIAGQIEMPEVARRYRTLVGERFSISQSRAASAAEHNPTAGEVEAGQPLDMEAEIKQLMEWIEPASKP